MTNRKLSPSTQLALWFLVFGTSWIMFTDSVLAGIAHYDLDEMIRIQTFKGAFFMLGASLVIYYVSRKFFVRQEVILRQLSEQKIFYKDQLAREVFKAQETERMKLGEELHDNINQLLGVVKLYIEHAMVNPAAKDDMLKRSSQYLMQVITEIRGLSKSLISSELAEFRLIKSVNEMIQSIIKIQHIRFEVNHEEFREDSLTDMGKQMLFRIMQEQLNNVIKHANAATVVIILRNEGPRASMTIQDDGVGFDTNKASLGLGFQNIRHRLELFSGEMKLESAPGNGCRMVVNFRVQSRGLGEIEQKSLDNAGHKS
ncbi:MAG TPA: ATP-binding protein [Flavitalea sp.]|nr:ATP-binding protein [Flavitalea sp.]